MPNSTSATPHWSSNFAATNDTDLIQPSAVYDQTTNTMIVFGGLSASLTYTGFDTNAVFLNAPATGSGVWSTLIPNGTAGSPPARDGHSGVYDSVNNRMIVFGGEVFSTGATFNDVWVLSHANGQGGTPTWTQLSPSASAPTARTLHTAVYDAANNLFPDLGPGIGQFNDVWVLANANGIGGTPAWTTLNPSGGPPGTRVFHTAVYDAVNNLMVIFGGDNDEAVYFVAWVLSDANGL